MLRTCARAPGGRLRLRRGRVACLSVALWTRTDRDLLSLALPTFATLVSEPLLVMADTAFIR